MPYVFRRPWLDSLRTRPTSKRFTGTIVAGGDQTITVDSPVTIPLVIPSHGISGTGVVTLTASSVTIPLVIPSHSITGSSPVSLSPSVVTIPLVIPSHGITGTGVASITGAIVTIPIVIPVHTIAGSGVVSITAVVVTIPIVIPSHSIAIVSTVVSGVSPAFSIIIPVTSDNFTNELVNGLAKLIDKLGGKNFYGYNLPPISNENVLRNLLTVTPTHEGWTPKLEAWFAGRQNIGNLTNASQDKTGNTIYQQRHGIRIVAFAWHGDLETSYQYIQDKTDELLGLLHKNLDLAMGSKIDLVNNFQAIFALDSFANHGLYRAEINFDAISTITESRAKITSYT